VNARIRVSCRSGTDSSVGVFCEKLSVVFGEDDRCGSVRDRRVVVSRSRSVGALAKIEWTEMVGRLAAKSVREVQVWWHFEIVESGLVVGFWVRFSAKICLGAVPAIAKI
jgi:hypothetical protein